MDEHAGTTSAGRPFNWSAFWTNLASVLLVALILAVGGGLIAGWRPMRERAVQMLSASEVSIVIDWPALARAEGSAPPATVDEATWLPAQLRERVEKAARSALESVRDPLSPEAVGAVGQAMQETGWFLTAPVVMRDGPASLRVSGRWRTPAAVVRFEGKDYLVGWDAKPLPVVYSRPGTSGMLFISGVEDAPALRADGTPDPGKPWAGSDVPAALELLDLMLRQGYASQIAGIDVGHHQDARSLELVTHAGTRVVWGGRPSEPLIGEATTAQKLEKLAWLDRKYKRIDAGRSTSTPIEVWWPLSRPLEIDRSATASAASGGP